jgi:methylase of polypeptide subunit release factors
MELSGRRSVPRTRALMPRDLAEMDPVCSEPKRNLAAVLSGRPSPDIEPSDQALLELGVHLKRQGYRFTTVSPASHARVYARADAGPRSLTAILGWNRSFAVDEVTKTDLRRLADAGVLGIVGAMFRSTVRFSTLGEQLFLHSSFPTEQSDAVFFGPDTYRFARLIGSTLETIKLCRPREPLKILDIGAGSGAGGLHAAAVAAQLRPTVTLSDVNRRALRFCKINATLNEVPNVTVVESDLFDNVEGSFDLIIANPPYLVDRLARMYRHGGGALGFELSLRIAEEGVSRLVSGGRLVLYTGSAIVNGSDLFYEALSLKLAGRGVRFAYEEIDPDVFGEELEHPPYDRADRIAVVAVTIDID